MRAIDPAARLAAGLGIAIIAGNLDFEALNTATGVHAADGQRTRFAFATDVVQDDATGDQRRSCRRRSHYSRSREGIGCWQAERSVPHAGSRNAQGETRRGNGVSVDRASNCVGRRIVISVGVDRHCCKTTRSQLYGVDKRQLEVSLGKGRNGVTISQCCTSQIKLQRDQLAIGHHVQSVVRQVGERLGWIVACAWEGGTLLQLARHKYRDGRGVD